VGFCDHENEHSGSTSWRAEYLSAYHTLRPIQLVRDGRYFNTSMFLDPMDSM
jgi:hypothetical protein